MEIPFFRWKLVICGRNEEIFNGGVETAYHEGFRKGVIEGYHADPDDPIGYWWYDMDGD